MLASDALVHESLPLIANRYFCELVFADVERAAASADWPRCSSILGRFTDALRRRICSEECILLPALLRTVSGVTMLIEQMRSEHVRLWGLLVQLHCLLESENGDAFLACCEEFVSLLRRHVACEEGVLYPIAEQARLAWAARTMEPP